MEGMLVSEMAEKFEHARELFARGAAGEPRAFHTACLIIGRLHEEWFRVRYEGKLGTKTRSIAIKRSEKLRAKIWEAQAAICLVSFGAGCYQAWKN